MRPRCGSKSTIKCGCCKKMIKDDDMNCIGCSRCASWVHGSCAGLSSDEIVWLGEKPNIQWNCDVCLPTANEEAVSSLTEAKLNSILSDFQVTIKNSVSEIVPGLNKNALPDMNENVKEAVTSSLPSYRAIVLNAKKPPSEPQFIITGIPEKEEKYFKQVEEDTKMVDDIIQHMGLRTEGNINAIRRLGKISKTEESDKGENSSSRCRPILVTATNPLFMNHCFARSHHLQTFDYRVYIKKLLSSADRQREKNILSKRYHMIHAENKDKKDFRIRNLKLYYQNKEVEIEST